jgi:hypothetical protein
LFGRTQNEIALTKEDMVVPKLIESARYNGDRKSIFGLLLLLEQEIRSEAQHSSVEAAMPKGKKPVSRRGPAIFRRYVE